MRQFFKGFVYAFRGIAFCIKNERNFRFDICVAVFMIALKSLYSFTSAQNAVFFLTVFLVLAAEAMNTAVEATVDLISYKHTKLGRIAKDTAAGSVLLTATGSVMVGIYLFFDAEVFKKLYSYISANPFVLLSIILYFVMAYLFTFRIFKNNKKDKENNND